MRKHSSATAVLFGICMMLAGQQATAALQLHLSTSESLEATVADEPSGDGSISFNEGLGSWVVNMTDGLGSAALGGPALDLVSFNVTSLPSEGTGGITIMLSETDLHVSSLPALRTFFGSISGVTQGSVAWEMWIDDGNRLFETSQLVDSGSFSAVRAASGVDFSGGSSASRIVDGLFSMTLMVHVMHGDGLRSTSFTFDGSVGDGARIAAVPEPGTLVLAAIALVTAATLRARSARRVRLQNA